MKYTRRVFHIKVVNSVKMNLWNGAVIAAKVIRLFFSTKCPERELLLIKDVIE